MKSSALPVHRLISEQNSVPGNNSIPHSDLFFREVESTLGFDPSEIKKIISILKDAHYIFVIEIVKEDRKNDISRVEGYVDATLPNVRTLKNYFQKALMDRYEREFNTRMMVHQIVRDIYARGSSFMNTPLGQFANKAIMLEEYQNLMEKEFHDYTEEWKERKLNEIISIYEKDKMASAEEKKPMSQSGVVSDPKRAVDSEEYENLVQSEHRSMKKMINIYGVEFFFRVNLRNCNFENITLAIENREIHRRPDLRILKDMIHKMKINMESDPKINENPDQLRQLERLVSRRS